MNTLEILRVGIIGTGSIAQVAHAPALHRVEGVEFWSVLSRDKERAVQFAREHGAKAPQPAHTSLSEFLSDPQLQAVIITSPDHLHATHILQCARAGKHVLVEKPMVVTHEEGVEVIETCRREGVTLAVGFHLRWHAGLRELHRRVTRENVLGPLRYIRLHWSAKMHGDSHWRARPDLGHWWLGARGSHCLDLIHWMADAPNRSIASRRSLISKAVWQGPPDETAVILFRYSDGLIAECATSVLFDAPSRLEIYGADGFAICEGILSRKEKGSISLNGTPLPFGPVFPFDGEIGDFAAAIREGREPEVSGAGGLQVVDDMLRAVAEG